MSKKVLVGNPTFYQLDSHIGKNELLYIIMDFPFGCNYNCPKCYRRQNVSFDNIFIKLRKRIIKKASELGAKVVGIPGEGEPLYHLEEIKEIIEFNNSLGLTTILYTNGSLLNRELVQFFFDNNVSLIVSIDSLEKDTYNDLTGGGDIEKIKENMKIAKEIYSNGVQHKDNILITRLGVITIVTKQNMDEISKIKNWCGDDIFFICNFPIKEGNATKNWTKLVGNDLDDLIKISHKFTDTGTGGVSTPLKDGKCVALYNGITVDTNGNVLVCPASVNTIIGNIKDETLVQLWKKIKEYTQKKGNPKCIARYVDKNFFRSHDGNILQHL